MQKTKLEKRRNNQCSRVKTYTDRKLCTPDSVIASTVAHYSSFQYTIISSMIAQERITAKEEELKNN